MKELATKFVAGSLVLIGVYLVVTNPNGASAVTNSITGGTVAVDKTLQGR